MAATQHSSPPPNLFNIVEHNHNHLKHKSKHGDEEQQEVFDYSHHVDDEPPETSCGSSRASLSSSPSHEFSFTVCSLYTSPPPSSTTSSNANVLKDSFTNTSSSTASSAVATAIDLSPADEIFFHGHLLPLHLLSGGHLSISPRSSTNSLDSFTLPITSNFSNPNNNDSSMDQAAVQDHRALNSMEKPKSRSFSLFRNRTTTIKSRKSPPENQETEENRSSKPHHDNDHHKHLNKVKFELTNAIKLVRSLLIFKQGNNSNNNSGRKGSIQMRGHQTFSYSGNLSSPRRSNKQGAEVLRGRFSAPASTRTSPTNSGMFLEGSRNNSSSSSSCNSDSTMEELQAAIQAAIAHCKNSSIAAAAVQDKI